MFSEPPDVKLYGSRVSPESGYDAGDLWTEHSVCRPSTVSVDRAQYLWTERRELSAFVSHTTANRRPKSLHKYSLARKEHEKVLHLDSGQR